MFSHDGAASTKCNWNKYDMAYNMADVYLRGDCLAGLHLDSLHELRNTVRGRATARAEGPLRIWAVLRLSQVNQVTRVLQFGTRYEWEGARSGLRGLRQRNRREGPQG